MSIKKIAYSTDFSDHAEDAFESALDLARKYEASLHILHVVPPMVNPMLADATSEVAPFEPEIEPEPSFMQKIEQQMNQMYKDRIGNIECEFVVLSGHVSTEIVKCLEEKSIDLVVMGSYGMTGVGLVVFGSVAKRVSHKAPCSVMIVRKPDRAYDMSD